MGDAPRMLGGGKYKLLWENPQAGGNAFPAQNINLNLKGYDVVGIVFDPQWIDGSVNSEMRLFYVGQGRTTTVFASFSDNNNIRRGINAVTESYVSFGEARVVRSSGTETVNNYAVPKQIWGIKF